MAISAFPSVDVLPPSLATVTYSELPYADIKAGMEALARIQAEGGSKLAALNEGMELLGEQVGLEANAPAAQRAETQLARLIDAGTPAPRAAKQVAESPIGQALSAARQSLHAADSELARPTEPFMPGTQKAHLDAQRPTTPGEPAPAKTAPEPAARPTSTEVPFEGRATTPGDPLQRARQAARIADPEFGRATEPFSPGTQQARLNEMRPTTQGESALARNGTPTLVDDTPFSERPTTQGASTLAKNGTPTVVDDTAQVVAETAGVADDAISPFGRVRGALRSAGEIVTAGMKSPAARAVMTGPTGLALAGAGLVKSAADYFDPRMKTFSDDVERLQENRHRITNGSRGTPAPLTYQDIQGRDDMPSNFRRDAAADGMGTTTGGTRARQRLTEIGGVTEARELINRGVLDPNFIRDAVSEMSAQERADMFTRNLSLPPAQFRAVYDALGGDDAHADMTEYITYATNILPGKMGEGADQDTVRAQNTKNIEKMLGAGLLQFPDSPEVSEGTPVKRSTGVSGTPSSGTGGGGSNLIRSGSRGSNVTEVQRKLSELGELTDGVDFDLGETGIDGVYGPKTKAAVEEFQRIAGIRVDGVVGPETLKALDSSLGGVGEGGAVGAAALKAEDSALPAPAPAGPEKELRMTTAFPVFGAGAAGEKVDVDRWMKGVGLDPDIDAMDDIVEIDPVSGSGAIKPSAFPTRHIRQHSRQHRRDDKLHAKDRTDSAAHERNARRHARGIGTDRL